MGLASLVSSPLAAKIGLGASFALGVALIVAGLWGMHQKSQRLKVEAAFAEFRAETNRIAAEASEAYRRLEASMRQKAQEAEKQAKERQSQHEKALASVRASADADRRMLVQRIAELGSSQAAAAGPAPEGEGTGAIGELLAEGLQLQAELAAAAESNADAYRALREAWPGGD